MNEVECLADALSERFGDVQVKDDYGWTTAPLCVVDCVLSLNRKYNAFVLPRVERFAENRPEVRNLAQLLALMDGYESLEAFGAQELEYTHAARMEVLRGVAAYLLRSQFGREGATEMERLAAWAQAVGPEDCQQVGVKGFGLAGFQYLRMLFGVQTTKPDVHIVGFVEEVLGHPVSPEQALALLEAAAGRARLPLREVDGAIWGERSGRGHGCSGGRG